MTKLMPDEDVAKYIQEITEYFGEDQPPFAVHKIIVEVNRAREAGYAQNAIIIKMTEENDALKKRVDQLVERNRLRKIIDKEVWRNTPGEEKFK